MSPYAPAAAKNMLLLAQILAGLISILIGLIAVVWAITVIHRIIIHARITHAHTTHLFYEEHGYLPGERPDTTIALPEQAESLAKTQRMPVKQQSKIVQSKSDQFEEEEDDLPEVIPMPPAKKKDTPQYKPVYHKVEQLDDDRFFVDNQVGVGNKGAMEELKNTPPYSSEEEKTEEQITKEEVLEENIQSEKTKPPAPELNFSALPKATIKPKPIIPLLIKKKLPDFLDLVDILNSGFWPSPEQILIGVTEQGLMTERVSNLWHIMSGGPSGGGKSAFQRLIQTQLMCIGAHCYMSNIHYNPYDKIAGLHWDMLEKRLIQPIAGEADETFDLIRAVIEELETRRQKAKKGEIEPEDLIPLFLFVEELPGVLLRLDEESKKLLNKWIAIILSEGRKYQVCYSGVAQSALISMIGGDSGIRSNIMTGIYTGGHPYTGKILLHLDTDRSKDQKESIKIDEEAIKKPGKVYAKTLTNQPTLALVPWSSDQAVEMLLGSPTAIPIRQDTLFSA